MTKFLILTRFHKCFIHDTEILKYLNKSRRSPIIFFFGEAVVEMTWPTVPTLPELQTLCTVIIALQGIQHAEPLASLIAKEPLPQ